MKLNAKFFALFFVVLSLTSLVHAADTLEVFVLLAQFKEEKPDNSLTTGTGLFGTDTGTYNLDPAEGRGKIYYWQKHLAFAKAYYKAASGGELVIKDSIIPTVYTLDKQMIDYNRTQRMKGEKAAEYDSARTCDYLRFVYDVVMKAHGSSPFASIDDYWDSLMQPPLRKKITAEYIERLIEKNRERESFLKIKKKEKLRQKKGWELDDELGMDKKYEKSSDIKDTLRKG